MSAADGVGGHITTVITSLMAIAGVAMTVAALAQGAATILGIQLPTIP
ncbi:hypothetical protein [Corynebacterium pseudogenitalium]|nr:hypothetical protein [Corynebacterium pseudogenitalium]MCQ4607232.1 hypothetical protein [Corynebacterium pseudogenitalium]UUA87980.1 hypothetical protein KBP54_03795 [Corynebacterium pseudogenitalium]